MTHADTPSSLMMDHAAGTLPDALALVVESHAALNPVAREGVAAFEAMGGLIIDDMDEAEISDTALDHVLARLERPISNESADTDNPVDHDDDMSGLPAAIRSYLPGPLHSLKWSRMGGGVREFRLPVTADGYRASLLSIAPGRSIPAHTHKGTEYTVVLDGAYTESDGARVETGDLVIHDERDSHQPLADAETGCLCLAVLSAPLKFKGPLGLILNPLQRL